MAKLIAGTYGEALFDLALEHKSLDRAEEEIKTVKVVFKENRELIKFLNHPKISKEEKIAFIENIFKGRISDDVTGFLVIIIKKGRHDEISAIFDYFLAKVREHKKIGVAYVISAIELNKQEQEKIKEKLLATTKYVQFEMNYKVDAAILGGLIIRIGDRVVDSSLRSKLSSLSKNLYKLQLE